MIVKKSRQKGFVLVVSMIFLMIMTVLAITSIQRATSDERIAGNTRSQNLAFQAAETALRFCQRSLEATGPGGALPLTPGTATTSNSIKIHPYPSTATPAAPPPPVVVWATKANWTTTNAWTLANGSIPNVAAQPQCMIEEYPTIDEKRKVYYAYVITARGVGATSTAVVWLQETLRVGNNFK